MKHSINGKYSIKYVWLGILSILISGAVLFYFLSTNNINFGVIEVIAYITGATATLTLIYHSFSLEYQITTQNNNNDLLKAKYTYEIISEWTKPSMMKSIAVTREILKNPERILELKDQAKIEEFDEFLNNNLKKRAHLVLILNYFENICTMIESKHIDNIIVKKAFNSLFTSYYKTLENFIDLRQKEYPSSWMYFEIISKKWILNDKMV